jgi:hypothetical protein
MYIIFIVLNLLPAVHHLLQVVLVPLPQALLVHHLQEEVQQLLQVLLREVFLKVSVMSLMVT